MQAVVAQPARPGLGMNAETCQAIAAFFPVAMLTAAIERRNIHLKLRKLRWFRWLMVVALAVNLCGLVAALVGVATDGLSAAVGGGLWALLGVSLLALATGLLMIMATNEVEEDEDDSSQKRVHIGAIRVRAPNWARRSMSHRRHR